MKKLKIGFLIPRLGITDRGAEVFVYELARRLRRDFDVVVWVRRSAKRSELLEELAKSGVVFKKVSCISEEHALAQIPYRFPFLRRFLDKFHLNPSEIEMLSFSIACLPQLLSEKIDLLFPVNGVWGSIICRLIRVVKGTPFVYATLGGIEPISVRQKPNVYIALFPTIVNWLKMHFPKLEVTFIPTGVDLEKFTPKGDRAVVNLPRPLFLTASALVPEKRVDLTIKAVGKCKKGSLLVVGDGPLKPALIQLADKTLGKDRFLFVNVSHTDMPKYYRAADVFAFSAPWEVGWSIVHLEALASGLPVVTHREENLEYLLGKDDSLLCDVEDTKQYSATLERALRERKGKRWRRLVENYSWDNVVDRYKKFLKELISNG